jgi:hypothetical protein
LIFTGLKSVSKLLLGTLIADRVAKSAFLSGQTLDSYLRQSARRVLMNPQETFTLTVNGQRYERWEEIRVTREIDRMATDFNIAVSERFLLSARITGSSPVTSLRRASVSL